MLRFKICLLLVLASAVAMAQDRVVSRVNVIGATQVSQEAIKAASTLRTGDKISEETLQHAQDAIERLGFFKSVKVTTAKTVNGDELVIQVQEWQVVEKIEVSGNKAIKTEDILKVLAIEVGKVFNTRTLIENVKQVRELYTRKGFYGDIQSIDFESDTSTTLKVVVVEMTVNSVTPYGNKRTKTDIIERLLSTKPEMPFNRNRWESDLRRLAATNWFTDVKSFSRESSLGRIDLVPTVEEGKTGQWTAGLGTEPGSPVVGTFGISETNIRGTGQSISFRGAQGVRTQGPTLEVTYGNPFLTRDNLALGVTVYTRQSYRFAGLGFSNGEDPSGNEPLGERRTGAVIGVTKQVDPSSSAQVGIRVEEVNSNSQTGATDVGITRQSGSLASLVFGFTRNRRDAEVNPSRGDWLKLGLEPGFSRITRVGGSLTGAAGIGDHPFVKTTAEYRAYWSPDGKREREESDSPSRVVALRVRYGSIYGEAPFSEQFFVGGTDTVRGYAQDRFWGNQMFISSLEYRHPIGKDVGLIGFVDYGGAWGGYGGLNDFTQTRGIKMNLGYGLGISYRVPKFGPLRIDFGVDRDGRVRSHFQISTPF